MQRQQPPPFPDLPARSTTTMPTNTTMAPAMRGGVTSIRGAPNNPNQSMSRPITTWPRIGNTTVCTAPRRGNSRMLPSTKHTPITPPSHVHHGADVPGANCGNGLPCRMVVATIATSNATENEISADTTG